MRQSDTSVEFMISWNRPSDRNGSFDYSLTFEAEQLGLYPESTRNTVPPQTIPLDGELEVHTFEGALPFANYTITLAAVNIKLNRPGPSVPVQGRTIAIGECSHSACLLVCFMLLSSLPRANCHYNATSCAP